VNDIKKLVSTPEGKIDTTQVFLAILALLVVIGLLGAAHLLVLDDNPPATINSVQLYREGDNTPVDQVETEPGGVFLYGLDWCKYTHTTTEVLYTWVEELVFVEPLKDPATDEVDDPGCGLVQVPVTVPQTLPPGEYYLDVTFKYRVNPVQTRNVAFTVGPIIVAEKE